MSDTCLASFLLFSAHFATVIDLCANFRLFQFQVVFGRSSRSMIVLVIWLRWDEMGCGGWLKRGRGEAFVAWTWSTITTSCLNKS
jgi:hypothetical protein